MENKGIKVAAALAISIIMIIVIVNKIQTSSHTTELMMAIRSNDIEKAKKEIDQGADVNAIKGFKGAEPLLIKAIQEGNPEMVSLLLSKGANPLFKQEASLDSLPLDYSISLALGTSSHSSHNPSKKHQKYIIPLLIDTLPQSHYPKIIPAILMGNIVLVKELLKSGDININDPNILRATIFSGDKEMISFVLNNIPEYNNAKKDMLSLAQESNNQEIIDYVLGLPDSEKI